MPSRPDPPVYTNSPLPLLATPAYETGEVSLAVPQIWVKVF